MNLDRLSPAARIVGLVAFVVVVALTPRSLVAAFVVDAAVVVAVLLGARVSPGVVAARLTVIVPFLLAAAVLPVIGDGERTTLAGLSLSVDGLWAGWNIAAKATLGATAGIIVTAVTPTPDLVAGLGRLRVPPVVVGIVSFMFRYLDLVTDDVARMRRAMTARGHDPRWLWQARPIAAATGALFVRTYERGERVHDAMLARGFTGTMPGTIGEHEPDRSGGNRRRAGRYPAVALLPAAIALGAALVAAAGR